MKRKALADIGRRTVEELDRLYPNRKLAASAIGCSTKAIDYWAYEGGTPSMIFLARFYYIGADVTYILTGSREKILVECTSESRPHPDLLRVIRKVATLNSDQLKSLDNLLSSFGCGNTEAEPNKTQKG